jgi:uncharacterized membrane protein
MSVPPPVWLVPLVVAALAYRLRLLQPAATLAGLGIGLAVVYSPEQPQHSLMLLVFFVAGSGSTKLTAQLRRRRAAAAAAANTTAQEAQSRRAKRRRRSPSRSRSPAGAGAGTRAGAVAEALSGGAGAGGGGAEAAGQHLDSSDAGDARRGRTLQQVLAVGLVPALLCLSAQLPSGRRPRHWQRGYLAYLAACAGDTLASELGRHFSTSRPLLITTMQPVAPGTDGAVSLAGTLASLLGGGLVGACAGASVHGLVLGVAAGFGGSVLDSLLGASR